VRLVRWQDFLARGVATSDPTLDWTGATPTPCQSASGQCFKVPNPGQTPRRVAEWLLVEGLFSALPGAPQ
jgi:hypothetical protein